ncbi:hypothetical protein [Proteiniborus sp. MB09-C3]|uniref:hypothetical protein n=1 Tax=Proteiniborus sp. MB09-C3 TaxID=3050072 RepID=UPI002552C940|nr:hypothetical protein [Proteiniborus sp. MB09-C3]WIV13804.1 hypothetical protein QO263_08935 [Proteiniborus sp. MB09-C3]
MKKTISIFLVLILMATMLIGCSPKEPANNTPKDNTPASGDNSSQDNSTPADETDIVKIGLGHITSIDKSKDLDGETLPLGQVDTVMAAVAFDKDGKVVKITIDTAQTKVEFDKDLQVISDFAAENKTKVELGPEYGMVKNSKIGKEWFEQAAELEKWMIGKTVDEIKAMKLNELRPDEAELTSSVTVTVDGYIAAVEEAYNNAIDTNSGAVTLGLGHDISISKSKGYANVDGQETLPAAEVNTTMAATAFDKDGKVVATIIDTAQTKVQFDKDGKLTTDKAGVFKTKVELGPEYGMIKNSKVGKEWFEQIAELEKWMVGKTANEIKAIKLKESRPDEAELTSSVTVTVDGYISSVVESYANAK